MTSRKRARKAAARTSVYRRPIPWPVIVGGLVLAIVVVLVVRTLEIGAPGERITVSGVGSHLTEGQPFQYAGALPPAGGPHWPAPAPWGVATAPVPDERAVHNLEHGGVVASHNGLAEGDVNALRALTLGYPRDKFNEVKLLVRAYDKIPAGTLVLTAWGWRQTFTAYDAAGVRSFLDAHLGRCCEDVP